MTTSTKKILQLISYCGLALSLIPAILVFTGTVTKETYLQLMLAGMFLWFGSAIFWVKKDGSLG